MSSKMKAIIGAAAFILFIAGAFAAYNTLSAGVSPGLTLAEQPADLSASVSSGAAETPEESAATEPERIKAPDFSVEDMNASSVKLSDMEGKPVVLNFWASWCPPCKNEMPEFDKVYAELGDEVVFMMVDLTDGQRETKEKGAEYVSEQGFSFPVYFDIKQEAAYAYGIRSIPTTIFIDSDGYIITGAEGQLDEATLRLGIEMIQS